MLNRSGLEDSPLLDGKRVPGVPSSWFREGLERSGRADSKFEIRKAELGPSCRYAGEFQLVILTEGPRFYTASAQVLGEL